MLTLGRGRVTAVVSRADGLARLEVDGVPCVAYPRLTGPVALGDEVIVNVQARELELGSGGFDVLYVNVTRGLDLASERGAHVMKLPYTPAQAAVPPAEERRELPGRAAGPGWSCGQGGLGAASAGRAARALGGEPILAVRASEGDPRERHRGVSHHVRDILRVCGDGVVLPWPSGWDAPQWLPRLERVD